MDGASTRSRVVDQAVTAFGSRGYDTTSLDALAAELGVRKQTILYYFPSKEALLDAAIDRAAGQLSQALEGALAEAGPGWLRVEAIVRSVFADHPEAYVQPARALAELWRHEEAEQLLREGAARLPSDAEIAAEYAWLANRESR